MLGSKQLRQIKRMGNDMTRIKSFTTSLEIFKTQGELDRLDEIINEFIAANSARVISVSDTTTTDGGSTIGLIRALTYEDSA